MSMQAVASQVVRLIVADAAERLGRSQVLLDIPTAVGDASAIEAGRNCSWTPTRWRVDGTMTVKGPAKARVAATRVADRY
jgi:hypothetical protein